MKFRRAWQGAVTVGLMNVKQIVQTILLGTAGDAGGGLLAALLLAVSNKVARRFQPPPQQAALQAALETALTAAFKTLPQTDPLNDYYLNCLADFLRQEVVQEELATLLDPRDPFDVGRLRDAFSAITQGYAPEQIPGLDFDAFLASLTHGFYAAVKNEPVLRAVIQLERLDTLVRQVDSLLQLTDAMRGDLQAIHIEARRAAEILVEIKELIAARPDNTAVAALVQAYLDRAAGAPAAADLRVHLAEYVGWVAGRCSTLELRGIKREDQQVVQLDLEAVYVPLSAVTPSRSRRETGEELRPIPMSRVLSWGRRLIITGGPGCGKTTILLYIAWTLAQALARADGRLAQERLGLPLSDPLPLPIQLPLGAYAAHLRKLAATPGLTAPQTGRLDAFIPRYLIESHASFDLPEDFFVELLKAQTPVILLLDGLDEVPNETERVAVRQAIEQLLTRYPQLRVVVTCRSAAYRDRTALGQDFREVRVQPLDDDQIAALIRQAYAHIYRWDVVERKDKTTALIQGARRLEDERRQRLGKDVPRLIDSPLLVRLLLIVHYSNSELPDQRADLYLRVINALLLPDYTPDQKVASALGGYVAGSAEAHLALAQHLAFHMHQRGKQQGRLIDEQELRAILALNPAYAPHVEAFIALTHLRGTAVKEASGTYTFLHLTFQEFLAARYLAEVMWQEEQMAAFLEAGPLLDSWWREPILLLAGYLYLRSPLDRAPAFVRRLAGLDDAAGERLPAVPADTQLAAAELAALGFLEWQREEQTGLRAELAGRLAALLAPDAPPAAAARRVAVGAALGRLGDPRPGVTTVFTTAAGRRLPDLPLCYVPAGPFWMAEGEDKGQEVGRVQTFLDYPYWIGRYPVTQAQFDCFVQAGGYRNPDYWIEARRAGEWREDGRVDTPAWRDRPRDFGAPFNLPNHPVVGIMWYEALAFCRWLTEHLALPAGWECHLPSEAEWEKAARGGLQLPASPVVRALSQLGEDVTPAVPGRDNPHPRRRYPWGEAPAGDRLTPDHANYGEKIGRTSAVGCYPRYLSPYGCADLIGNVWEWTRSQDGPLPYNPHDGREAVQRVKRLSWIRLRGGSWYNDEASQRCGARAWDGPGVRYDHRGFRVVLSPLSSLASDISDL